MAALGRLVAELGLDSAQFTEGLKRAQKGFDDFERSFGRAATGALTSFAGQLIALETASKVADAAISAFTETVKGLAALDDAAEKTGATVESLAKLQAQAVISGQAFEGIETALIKLNKGLIGADDETKSAGAALEALGIKARGANGELKDAGTLMFEVSKKFAEFSDKGPGKAAIAMDLFGKAGAQLLPVLKDLQEAGDANVVVTAAQAQAADDYEKNIKRLAAQKLELKRVIVSEVLPAANEFLTALLDLKKNGEGLAATVKQLAEDGSIAKWAREGAIAIGQLIDQSAQGVNQFKALAKDLEGLAIGGKGVLDILASGAARAAGQIGVSIDLQAQGRENLAKATSLFAESERIASQRVTTYTNAISAQTGAFDDARDRALKLATATDGLTKETLKYAGASKAGKDEAAAFAKTLESLLAKITGKDAGVDATFGKEIETLVRAQREGKISTEQYAEAIQKLARQQPVNIKLTKDMEEATKDLAKAAEEEYKLMLKNVPEINTAYEDLWLSMQKQLEASNEELKLFGLTGTAREKALVDIRLQAALTKELTDVEKEALIVQAEKLKQSIEARGAAEVSAKSFADQLEASKKIEDSVAGFFENLFLNGKKAFDDLGQTVKRFFAQLAAQFASKFVLNIAASVLGLGGAGTAGASGLGFLGNLFSGGSVSAGGLNLGSLGGLMGLGSGAGFLGTVGAGAQLGLTGLASGTYGSAVGLASSSGGLAGTVGSLLPILIPLAIVAGLAAYFSKDEKGIKFDNSLRNIAAPPANVQISALGNFAPSGDVDANTLQALQPFLNKVKELDNFIAKNLFTDQTLADVRERIQAVQNPRWWNLDDKGAIEKASKYFLQQRYSIAFDALEAGAGDLIRNFEGTADELLVYIQKLGNSAYTISKLNDAVPGLNLTIAAFSKLTDTAQQAFTSLALSIDAFNTNTNQTVADLIDSSSRGVVSNYERQAEAMLTLRDGLADGSVSIEDFATGIGNLATAYAQATSKIADTKRALEELFTNSQEGFLLQSLSVDEKYAYYQQQAEALYAQLANATDPEVIDRLARKIDSLQNAAFGLLSPEQQGALAGDFISGSQRVEDLVNARLAAAGDLLDKNNANLREVIRDALADFATQIKAVADQEQDTANINLDAANTPQRLDIIIHKDGEVEVGQI